MNRPRLGPPRRVILVVVAVLLFTWTFLYRFNTLGGALGGFDNDHFVLFALAKQVEAGEQPLRDFVDAMYGARPSLAYELSAAAQRYFGDNLRSEAWLTVTGVALGATLAFLAGSRVAPWPWALATALVSVLLAPKLYGYPKVLITAIASLMIVAGRPTLTWRRVAGMSIVTAAAFLYRHDFIVYCAAGFTTLIVFSPAAHWRDRAVRAAGYIALTAILIGPSLLWIERYSGLVEYVRNSRELSREEYERTKIGWPRFVFSGASSLPALLEREENAKAWIYYIFLVVPVAGIGVAASRLRRAAVEGEGLRADALAALSMMTGVLWYFALRGNLDARFGDMAVPVAVLTAYLLATVTSPTLSWLRRLAIGAPAVMLFVITLACIWNLNDVLRELDTSRLIYAPRIIVARTRQVSRELVEMPRALREGQAADRMQAEAYLHECTRPTDRVVAVGYYPEVPTFAERLFAGARVTFVVGNYAAERYAHESLAKLESQSVPIVLGGREVDYSEFKWLADYLHARYDEVGVVMSNGESLRVWARRGLSPTKPGPQGLPCFG